MRRCISEPDNKTPRLRRAPGDPLNRRLFQQNPHIVGQPGEAEQTGLRVQQRFHLRNREPLLVRDHVHDRPDPGRRTACPSPGPSSGVMPMDVSTARPPANRRGGATVSQVQGDYVGLLSCQTCEAYGSGELRSGAMSHEIHSGVCHDAGTGGTESHTGRHVREAKNERRCRTQPLAEPGGRRSRIRPQFLLCWSGLCRGARSIQSSIPCNTSEVISADCVNRSPPWTILWPIAWMSSDAVQHLTSALTRRPSTYFKAAAISGS